MVQIQVRPPVFVPASPELRLGKPVFGDKPVSGEKPVFDGKAVGVGEANQVAGETLV